MSDSHLTEERIDSRQLVDGVLLKVFRDRVRLPDGGESVREWIDHPGASAVIPVLDDGRVILVRQFRYAAGKTFIEIPAGKLDVAGEDPLEAAKRELEEETGWMAKTIEPIGSLFAGIGFSNEIIHCFVASDLVQTTGGTDADEFIELLYVSFDEAIEMVTTGEISDMKSVAALLLANATRSRA